MVGLTESKNGSWDPIGQNRDAALMDLRQRLAIDWRRVVFGGDSGGARASARSQVMYPDLCAGLLMSIAGYEQGLPPEKRIPVFFITGDTDFNLQEILSCFDHSKKMGRETELIRHKGGHTNGGKENIETALRWLHEHLGPYGAKPAAPVKKR
jgi:predicted esterase